jgi:cytoskeletal protein RodZ
LTSGTRRGGTGKFSSSKLADSPLFTPRDETIAYGDVGTFSAFGREEPTVPLVPTVQPGYADGALDTGSEGREPGLSRNSTRYTGRHGTRKRVRRVVPVVAVAATLAAGAAAVYGLSGGVQPRSANTNASLALHHAVASTPVSAVGEANGAASAPIKIATATARDAARVVAKRNVKAPSSRAATAAKSAAASSPATPAAAKASASAPATQAAAPASTPATHTVAATTLSCNASAGLLPQNVSAIVSFLLAHGLSDNAAAGIAGNIYQESKGDPESVGSGGGGLIGWTPLPAGFVTGNVTADLQTQLAQILTYNQIWVQFLPALNSAASPAAAADIYVTDFERAGIPAASTREASAQDVASACGI